MDKDAFLAELIASYWEHDCMDIDGCDFQDLLLKHGFAVEAPATEEDCKEEWALEYGYEPGDPMIKYDREIQLMVKAYWAQFRQPRVPPGTTGDAKPDLETVVTSSPDIAVSNALSPMKPTQ